MDGNRGSCSPNFHWGTFTESDSHQDRVPGEAALEELEPDVRGLLPVEPELAHPPLVPRLLGGVEPPPWS